MNARIEELLINNGSIGLVTPTEANCCEADDSFSLNRLRPIFAEAPALAAKSAAQRVSSMSDIVVAAVKELDPDVDLVLLCARSGGKRYAQIRDAIIVRLYRCGFRRVEIARYFNLSPARVTQVLAGDRPGLNI